jgi:methyl-accepting chemotaxis protein
MTLIQRMMALAAAGLLTTLLMTAIAMYGQNRIEQIVELNDMNVTALGNNGSADMMHDALRGDVLDALLKGPEADLSAREEASAAVREHAALFREMIAENESLALSQPVRSAMADTKPALDAYIRLATETVELAFEDPQQARAELAQFMDGFEILEERMGALGELIAADAAASHEQVDAVLQSSRRLQLLALLLGAIGLCLIAWTIIRQISAQVGGEPAVAARAMNDLMAGHHVDPLPLRAGDGKSLFSSINQTIQRFVDSQRILAALEKVNSNVMIADTNLDILYMNESIRAMLANAEHDVRRDLPHFDARKLIGQNIDQFHKNPAHQRSMLGALNGTHRAQIMVGGRTFTLLANPVFGSEGKRIGTVVEWRDRTQEVAVEAEVQQIVSAAVAGDLGQRIDAHGKEGFFATLSSGINELLSTLESVINETVSTVSAMAQGDLTRTIESDYVGSFGQLKEDMNATIGKLTGVVRDIQESAYAVKTGSDEIASGNQNLSQRTEQQASSLEETSSAMEEMTATVRQSADNARQANTLAKSARDAAETGGNVVGNAVRAMSEINASSRKIADIIGVIDEIAFQTNLLALNASVEAARAGEQGRGFAVVASEVRNLAGRSATAAKEIKDLIQDSGAKVEEGAKLVNRSGEVLSEIVTAVKKVTDIIEEIAVASAEQAAGIDEVSKAVSQMDSMTQQNAALVEQAAAASESLGEQAEGLQRMIGFFNIGEQRMAVTAPGRAPAARQALPSPKARPVARQAAKLAKADDDSDGEWSEF